MLVELNEGRLVNVATGVGILVRRGPWPKVHYYDQSGTLSEYSGDDAVKIIDALDEILRRQHEELLEQRVGLCGTPRTDPEPIPPGLVPMGCRVED